MVSSRKVSSRKVRGREGGRRFFTPKVIDVNKLQGANDPLTQNHKRKSAREERLEDAQRFNMTRETQHSAYNLSIARLVNAIDLCALYI